jgi:long-chain fatty acid transport protein
VAFALPQDSLVIATNPAGLSLLSDRADVGLDWFIPRRSSEIDGNQTVATLLNGRSANGEYDGNGRKNFYIPEGGYSHRLNDVFSVGLALYGNGGLNTDYKTNPFAAFQIQGTPRNAGVDFAQFYVAPALSVKLGERQSIGLAVNLIYQRFKATGLQAFALPGYPSPQLAVVGPFSESPDNVTDKGYDNSFGIGYRLGYLVEPLKGLSFGISGAPKIHMSRFDKYKGLFADHGSFDVPANFGGGVAYRWRDWLVLSSDIQRILYANVESVGDPLQPFVDGKKLGSDGGPGFGWRDMTVYKFGLGVRPLKWLMLETGYSYGRQPIPQDQTLFNILAPGVITRHYTAGALVDLGAGYELKAYYLYAPENTVHGQNSIPPNSGLVPLPPQSFGGGEADIRLKEQAVGLALGIRF